MIVAATPFPLEQGGALFLPEKPGFQQINSTLGKLGEKTKSVQAGMTGLDAIPSCIAHLMKIHSDMQSADIKERYCEERWRKVMVVYVLSKYRGYDLSVDRISEKNTSPLVWEIVGKKLVQETQMGNAVFMLQFQGTDIAVFDRDGYLLPVAQFPEDVEQELGENCIEQLEDYEKNLLLSYLEGLLGKTKAYQYYIRSFAADLRASGAKAGETWETESAFSISALEEEDTLVKQKKDFFYQIPKLPLEMPSAFHSKLVLSGTDYEGDSFGKGCSYHFQAVLEGNPYYFSGLLPLSEKMADFIQAHDRVRLDGVTVDDDAFMESHRLNVKLNFTVDGKKISLKKSYGQEDIIFVDSVPMVTIFPYVDLPKDFWRRYYIVLKKNGSFSEVSNVFRNFEVLSGGNIDILQDSSSCSTETEQKEQRQEWFYARCSELPSFIKLCTADFGQTDERRNAGKKQNYIGCICVGKPKTVRSSESRTLYWALDMGTRNTIAAWREEQERQPSFVLSREFLYCPLLAGMGEMGRDFARECYAPIERIDTSFTTMVRIYKSGREGQGEVCYEHGCALFPDMELIERLIEQDRNWEKAAIFTDIKFGENDQVHETALQIFLYNMLWLGSLECALNGANEMKALISYPREAVKKRIEKLWNKAVEMMEEVSDIKIDLSYCSEAEANARYLQKVTRDDPSMSITGDHTFGICDIGDGTSDFNLYLGRVENQEIPARVQFSMRYAGRDILVDTIRKFGEKHRKAFKKLWKIPSDDKQSNRIDNLIKSYGQMQGNMSADGDETGEGWGEAQGNNDILDKERRRNIILALIEYAGLVKKLDISTDPWIKNFAAILTFKYWNLFHVYGNMLRKFVRRPVSFKLFVYGGGRKALQSATGESLDQFAATDFGRDMIAYLGSEAGVGSDSFSISLQKEKALKTEVVEGMLEREGADAIKNKPFGGREGVDRYYQSICAHDLPERRLGEEQILKLYDGYQKYIQDAKDRDYFALSGVDGGLKSVYECISVGEEDELTDTERKNRSLFRNSSEKLWNEVTGDSDNPSCLWEVLFYLKMSNYLLEKNVL